MIGCPLCGEYSPSITRLLAHIRLVHADEPGFNVQCGIQGCSRTFRKYLTFRNHVYAIHGTSTPQYTHDTEQNEGEDDVYIQDADDVSSEEEDDVTYDAVQRETSSE